MRRVVIAVAVAACGGGASQPVVTPAGSADAISSAPEAKKTETKKETGSGSGSIVDKCVPADSTWDKATGSDKAIDACIRIEIDATKDLYDRSCWTFDLVANTWSFKGRHPEPPDVSSGSGSDVSQLQMNHVVRADGAYIADWDDTTVKVTDKAGKLVHTFKGWHTGMAADGQPAGLRTVKFLDDTIAVYVAVSPITDSARLYDPKTGKQLGAVNPDNGLFEDDPTPLGNHRFAFIEMPALSLTVVDVATGRKVVERKLADLDHAGSTPALVQQLPDGAFVVVEERQVLRVDAAGKVTHYAAPQCPAKTPPP